MVAVEFLCFSEYCALNTGVDTCTLKQGGYLRITSIIIIIIIIIIINTW